MISKIATDFLFFVSIEPEIDDSKRKILTVRPVNGTISVEYGSRYFSTVVSDVEADAEYAAGISAKVVAQYTQIVCDPSNSIGRLSDIRYMSLKTFKKKLIYGTT